MLKVAYAHYVNTASTRVHLTRYPMHTASFESVTPLFTYRTDWNRARSAESVIPVVAVSEVVDSVGGLSDDAAFPFPESVSFSFLKSIGKEIRHSRNITTPTRMITSDSPLAFGDLKKVPRFRINRAKQLLAKWETPKKQAIVFQRRE